MKYETFRWLVYGSLITFASHVVPLDLFHAGFRSFESNGECIDVNHYWLPEQKHIHYEVRIPPPGSVAGFATSSGATIEASSYWT